MNVVACYGVVASSLAIGCLFYRFVSGIYHFLSYFYEILQENVGFHLLFAGGTSDFISSRDLVERLYFDGKYEDTLSFFLSFFEREARKRGNQERREKDVVRWGRRERTLRESRVLQLEDSMTYDPRSSDRAGSRDSLRVADR